MKVVPPSLDTLLDDENDDNYKQRSRTPPLNETFSHVEERYQKCKRRNPSPRSMGHDAMSRALD